MLKPFLKITLIVFLSLTFAPDLAFGQYVMGEEQSEKPARTESAQFFGMGTGINDIGLLGAQFEYVINPEFSAYATLGLGGWGYKLGLGASYYFKGAPFGPSFNLGYTHATGIRDFEMEMAVKPNDDIEAVVLDLYAAGTINATYAYHWTLGKKGKLSIITGYAFSTSAMPYNVKTPGVALADISHQILNIQKPGGVVLGIRFMKGI